MKVERYNESNKIVWDEFVSLAKNKHFFFFRDFIEYHSDRFEDHSLMFYDDNEKLVSILPANIVSDVLFSHQGLTFGGLIVKPTIKQKEVNDIFLAIKSYLKSENITSLIYKKIPYIYHTFPCDEDLYSLFMINASLIRRDVSSSIKLNNQIKYSKGRKWIVKKAAASGLNYSESNDIKVFWDNLISVLMVGHGASPVHSYEEMLLLKDKFPEGIKFYSAYINEKQIAGAVIFSTDTVAHTQYLFNTSEGRDVGALDGLIDHLVKNVFNTKEYFDFGTSNEKQGRYLNEGLISQKEGFGARAITHDFYEINLND